MRHSPHQLISGRDCARTKVPHASLRGQGGSKEDGTHLLDVVLQPCAQAVTHPPWIGMFLLSVFRIPPALSSVQNSARRHDAGLQIAPVCTETSIRVDLVGESPTVSEPCWRCWAFC